MSFNRLWLFLAISLPVLASLIAPMSTVDLAYQLRAGSEILATGAIPTVDTWTFTVAGQPWFDQQWGAQVILTVVERFGGWTGLAIFRALLVGGIVAVLVVIARRRGVTRSRGPPKWRSSGLGRSFSPRWTATAPRKGSTSS